MMLLSCNQTNTENRAILEAQGFFEELQLPCPKEGGFHRTHDQGALSLITHYGCSVRITPIDQYPKAPHRRFLRPLFSRANDLFHMAINPGVSLDVGYSDILKFKKIFSKEGIEALYYEVREGNVGKLPPPYNRSIVMLDPGGIEDVYNSVFVDKAIANEDAQGKIFKGLRESFEQAWPVHSLKSDPVLIKRAWKKCEEATQKSLLQSPWTFLRNDHAGTYYQSQRYSQSVLNYQERIFS